MKGKKSLISKVGISFLVIILIFALSFYAYTLDYSRALPQAIEKINNKNILESREGNLIKLKASGKEVDVGIIFYPGGKVDYKSYIPISEKIMEGGYDVFIVKMPFNLAVFNQDAADEIIKNNEEIKTWYLAGHSLGGAMASIYASKNNAKVDGLILLAAYPSADFSESNIPIISIYGSNDKVLNLKELEDKKSFASKETSYYVIEGGNHAYFGNYGEQKGDGKASITLSQQQESAVSKILDFIDKTNKGEI